jgi:hypothetical protein
MSDHCSDGEHDPSYLGAYQSDNNAIGVVLVYGCHDCNAWCTAALEHDDRKLPKNFFGDEYDE